MPACAVAACRNYTKTTKGTNVKYFSFPHDPIIQEEWIWRCGRETEFNVNNSRICSEHFTKDDFERDLMNELLGLPTKRMLKPTALPSINISVPRQGKITSNNYTESSYNHQNTSTDAQSDSTSWLLKNGEDEEVVTTTSNSQVSSNSNEETEANEVNVDVKSKKNGKKSWSRTAVLLQAQKTNEKLKLENAKLKKQVKMLQSKLDRVSQSVDGEQMNWKASYMELKCNYEALQNKLKKYEEDSPDKDEDLMVGVEEEEEDIEEDTKRPKRSEFLCKTLTQDSQKLLSEAVAAALEKTQQEQTADGTAKVTMIRDDDISLEQSVIVIELPPSTNFFST